MIQFITDIISSSFLYTMAITLLHSLWQGALLVFLMNLYLKYGNNDSPSFRYNTAFTTLLLIAISAIFTFTYYSIDSKFGLESSGILPSIDGPQVFTLLPSVSLSDPSPTLGVKSMIPLISTFWLLGVLIFSIRLILGYFQLINIKRSLALDVPLWFKDKLENIKSELGIEKAIVLGISNKVLSPVMMGIIKPIIIFPVSAINHLSPEELELILRHELGHIVRQDFIQNFILRTIEILMFYHPSVWWTIKIMENERENHCDDYAVNEPKNRLLYAKTLLKIKEMEASQNFNLALGFSKDGKSLLNRIHRILHHNQKMSIMKGNVIGVIVLLSSVICLSAGTFYYNKLKTESLAHIESKQINSLVIDFPSQPLKILSFDTDTTKDELKEIIKEKEDNIKTKSREMRESLKKMKDELKELKKEDGDHSYSIHVDADWDEDDWTKFGERMEELGRKFEEKMDSEEFEEKMEALGKKFEKEFDSKEFEEKMEKWGEEFAEKFNDEDFQTKIANLAEAGSDFGLGVASNVLYALGEEFDYNFNFDDGDFSFENIEEMVSTIVEGVSESVGDLEGFDHDFIYINSDKNDFSKILLDKLKEDGYYKKQKVSLTMDEKGMKINGKTPSREIREKYYDLIANYHDIDKDSGHKLTFKYSDKRGKKKNSLSIEKSN